MTDPFIPLINGKSYEWADIILNVLGVPIAGVTAISYGEKQDIKNIYGAGRFPVSRANGALTPNGKISLLFEEIQAIMAAAPNGRIQDIAEFDIMVSFIDASLIPVTHKLRNCRFMNNDKDTKQGDTSIPTDMELCISHVQWI